MSRYIDADKIEYFTKYVGSDEFAGWQTIAYKYDIDAMPTADVVEVVRCKDCQHYIDGCCYVSNRTNKGTYPRVNIHSRKENDFCSYGERRTE